MTLNNSQETPIFCPNSKCLHHKRNNLDPWPFQKYGSYKPKWNRSLVFQRFRCTLCKNIFSMRTFDFAFKQKRRGLEHLLLTHFEHGASNRQTAKALGCSEYTVRHRCSKLAQAAILFHHSKTQHIKINEALAYDGVENFSRSQYEPNNVNHIIGQDSLFVYDLSFSALNRKGYMSPAQKRKKLTLEQTLGRFDPQSIRWATARVLLRILEKIPQNQKLLLHSDNHFLYRRALECDLKKQLHKIEHTITPGTNHRTFKNLLFPINHMDNLLRHQIKAFTRETIAFSKTQGAMVQKYFLFAVLKNYCHPKFAKKHEKDPLSNQLSPAQYARVTTKLCSKAELFQSRPFATRQKLPSDWAIFFKGKQLEQRIPLNKKAQETTYTKRMAS